jgi:hypothetical protein
MVFVKRPEMEDSLTGKFFWGSKAFYKALLLIKDCKGYQ